MIRFAPILLLIGILFNCVCVLVFRLRLDRSYARRFNDFSKRLESQVSSMSSDALRMIDTYFASNSNNRVSTSDVVYSPSDTSPVFSVVGDWSYNYSIVSGVPYASVGFTHYTVGDSFPRGGVITSIHPDGVCINDRYWVSNSLPSSKGSYHRPSSFSDNFSQQLRKVENNVGRLDTGIK